MENMIQKFYIGYYGRPADPDGLNYWTEQAENEGWKQVREAFAQSPEARDFVFTDPNTGQELNSGQLVDSIYQNLFGRKAEQQGLNFYQERLDTGASSRAEIVQQIIDGASGQDLEILENKLEVADYFTDHVGDADYEGQSGIAAGREVLGGEITNENLPQAKMEADQTIDSLRSASEDELWPTDSEQYLLTLINQARQDPGGEADKYDFDLNSGLPEDTISPEPKQPLAYNPELTQAARDHSDWMLQTNTFDHTGAENSTPEDRMQDAGYEFKAPWAWGENLAWRGSQLVHDDYIGFIQDQHESLLHSPGHRENTMLEEFREVGIGVRLGEYEDYFGPMTSINFARSGEGLFLTGTVYEDDDSSGTYTPGEGLGGVLVQAGEEFTTSWDSGGYVLELPAGFHEITFTGDELNQSLSREIEIQDQNVLLDVIQDAQTGATDSELFNPAGTQGTNLAAAQAEGVELMGMAAGQEDEAGMFLAA